VSGVEPGTDRRGRAGDGLDEARVFEFMHPGIVTCGSSTPLDALAERMAGHGIHCVVVLPEIGQEGLLPTWGVATDLDLVRAAARGRPGLTAGEIATSAVVTVDRDEPLIRAAQLMADHETSHLVVSARGRDRPVGIISTLDVARCLAPGIGALVEDLRAWRAPPEREP
jgi:CBS domain-containing protein